MKKNVAEVFRKGSARFISHFLHVMCWAASDTKGPEKLGKADFRGDTYVNLNGETSLANHCWQKVLIMRLTQSYPLLFR